MLIARTESALAVLGVGSCRTPRRGSGLEVAGGLVGRVGEDDVVDDLGDPAVVAQLERAARLVQRRLGAAHELDQPGRVQHVGGDGRTAPAATGRGGATASPHPHPGLGVAGRG